jgi:hypothetical protein
MRVFVTPRLRATNVRHRGEKALWQKRRRVLRKGVARLTWSIRPQTRSGDNAEEGVHR